MLLFEIYENDELYNHTFVTLRHIITKQHCLISIRIMKLQLHSYHISANFSLHNIFEVVHFVVSVNMSLNTNDLQEKNRIISRWQFLLLILKHDAIDLANLLMIVFTFVVMCERKRHVVSNVNLRLG